MTRDKDSDHWRESLSLRIPKGTGETAIRLLAKLELLDTALSPRTVGALLHVPLSRAPANAEKNELDKTIGEHRLSHERFHQRAKIGGSLEQALVGQIPAEIIHLVSKSFDVIGDIAIIELNPRTEIFEAIIAEAIMKLHNNVRAVFSKTGPISDDKRLRPLHHVAGEDKTETVHKEGGCRLKVDIAKAFFSPRLSTEHLRVAQQVKPRECVVDMFAGVGPFSVLIAKRVESVRIHAIDHNPDATRLAEENARLNKVADKITVWTGDARIVSKKNLSGVASRVIMNHPSRAREFLKPACETLGRSRGLLHYYTFADGPDSESKAERELKAGLVLLDRKISILSTRKVRGVAPMKWQIVVDAELALS